jgi:hypothetical protein
MENDMDRLSNDEAREILIGELLNKELDFRKALLAAGDMQVVREVGDSVTDYLAFAYDDLHDLVLGKKTFEQIRDKVMADEAEVEALKQVEAIEQRRKEEQRQARIERMAWDREIGVLI